MTNTRESERMLESCATVEQAIAFYTKYRESQFSRAKILVADRSGASAIIGAHDGSNRNSIRGGKTLRRWQDAEDRFYA